VAPRPAAIYAAEEPSAVLTRLDGPVTANARARRVSPAPGNPGAVPLPPEAAPLDTSHPDVVVGTGSPASCRSAVVVDAVARGGIITFDCGPGPVTIGMTATAKVVNTSPVVVLDGGGKVTLSGADQRRIVYMNTCDQAQVWTTPHCQDQEQPQLTIQRLGFMQGNSTGDLTEGGGGGAIYLDGNRFTLDLAGSIVHDNTANEGGGAIFFVSNDRTGELRITRRCCSATRVAASRRWVSRGSSSSARASRR
jgi:hypothetical protein